MLQGVVTISANPVTKPIGAETPTDALGVTKRMSKSEPQSKESFECPSCDETFDTKRGVKIHHARTHGESLVFEVVKCDECGSEFEKRSAKMSGYEQTFCSAECQHKSYNQKEPVSCDNCGKTLRRSPSKINENNFCSVGCRGEWMSQNATGKKSPNWKGGEVESVCKRCGTAFSHRSFRDAKFCSNACFHSSLSENAKPDSLYYGASWGEQRELALTRDSHECVICGPADLVDVHHIHPFREFGVENHEEANALDNLVCLCRQHHSEWEGIPLRPEVSAE